MSVAHLHAPEFNRTTILLVTRPRSSLHACSPVSNIVCFHRTYQKLNLQMVNKLMYRSKQRGFLELDLLVGLWAEKELPRMSLDNLNSFSTVLDQVGGIREARNFFAPNTSSGCS